MQKWIWGISWILLAGCSRGGDEFIVHKRTPEFYQRYINTNENFSQAAQHVSELKLLQTDASFPMRFALFENGKFYYEIDKLGNGVGRWSHLNGSIELVAERVIFDMYLYVSGAKPEGEETLVRFVDRHGLNSKAVEFRNPNEMQSQGVTPPELPLFQGSDKNI